MGYTQRRVRTKVVYLESLTPYSFFSPYRLVSSGQDTGTTQRSLLHNNLGNVIVSIHKFKVSCYCFFFKISFSSRWFPLRALSELLVKWRAIECKKKNDHSTPSRPCFLFLQDTPTYFLQEVLQEIFKTFLRKFSLAINLARYSDASSAQVILITTLSMISVFHGDHTLETEPHHANP